MSRAKIRRPASLEERELIGWLLRHAATTPDVDPFLAQIPDLHVVGMCGCGCPSIDFQVGGQDAVASIIADAEGNSPEGIAVGVMLWAREGRLSGLEVYDVEGDQQFRLPRPEMLKPNFGSGAV